jgi:hypothetical protein
MASTSHSRSTGCAAARTLSRERAGAGQAPADLDRRLRSRVGAGVNMPLDVREVQRRQRHQPEHPPAKPRSWQHQRAGDRARADAALVISATVVAAYPLPAASLSGAGPLNAVPQVLDRQPGPSPGTCPTARSRSSGASTSDCLVPRSGTQQPKYTKPVYRGGCHHAQLVRALQASSDSGGPTALPPIDLTAGGLTVIVLADVYSGVGICSSVTAPSLAVRLKKP